MSRINQKITPFLWFNSQATEAAAFYVSLFPGSRVISSGTVGGGVEVVEVELSGQRFTLMGTESRFTFNESVSFVIDCEDQEEVDRYWERLAGDGGEESMCGWCKDKYGVSWQVTPRRLIELMNHPDKEKASRVMQAMMGMRKIDLAALEKACDGKSTY